MEVEKSAGSRLLRELTTEGAWGLFVPCLAQSGKASEFTFYFTSVVKENRKQVNLVFHQDQNHKQT